MYYLVIYTNISTKLPSCEPTGGGEQDVRQWCIEDCIATAVTFYKMTFKKVLSAPL